MKNLYAAVLGSAAWAALLAAAPAEARGQRELVGLINAYRAAPDACNGRPGRPMAPLAAQPALDDLQVATGAFLDQLLETRGYPVAKADAIHVSGPADARAVMAAIAGPYCGTLLSAEFSAVGAGRRGDNWLVVFARPAPPPAADALPLPEEAGKAILQAVNTARAGARSCGEQYFPPAAPVSWNGALGNAALAHSRDMAEYRYFSHRGRDGRAAADRALQAGYRWRRIGENIASGQASADDAVAGWLSSPGHCANIMNGAFTEMGASYAISRGRTGSRVYWTQVFAVPR